MFGYLLITAGTKTAVRTWTKAYIIVRSPGYGVSLVAETTTGIVVSHDDIYDKGEKLLPEDIGERAALGLLNELYNVNLLSFMEANINQGRVR